MSLRWINVNRIARETGQCQCVTLKGKELGICRAPVTIYMTRCGASEKPVCDYHRDVLLENGWDELREYEGDN